MNKHKILLEAGYFPYPANHGGKVDVWNRILGLHQLGFTIDLLFTDTLDITENELLFVKKYVNKLFPTQRKNRVIDLLKKKPLQVLSRNTLKL